MTTGSAWTNTTPASVSKLNFMEIVSGTGTELAALDKTKHRLVTCTSTGSGFTLDHVYLFSTDGTTAIDLGIIDHTHSGTGDGGKFINIFLGSPKVFDLILTKATDLYEANWASAVYWIRTVTSTGTVENKTDGTTGERSIRLRTNGTSGATATISYPHLKLDFSQEALYQTKLQIETFSSIALHTGVGADDTSAADSNTRKFQAEICTVTNNNWWLRTANNSANSASDTGIAATANRVAVKIKHYPSLPETDLIIDTGTVLQKTTNIPTSGATADSNLIKHSVKNSTAADRPLLVYGSRLVYTISDNWV